MKPKASRMKKAFIAYKKGMLKIKKSTASKAKKYSSKSSLYSLSSYSLPRSWSKDMTDILSSSSLLSLGAATQKPIKSLSSSSMSSITGTSSSTPSSSKVKKPKKQQTFTIGDRIKLLTREHNPSSSSIWKVGHIGVITDMHADPREYEAFELEIDDMGSGWVSSLDCENLTEKQKKEVTLKSVILNEKKIEEIKAAISQVENQSQIFEDWGFSEVFEKGTAISMLFWGIPGTGKTLMAQAVADSINANLKIIGTADIQSSEPGGAERTIKTIFAEANKANKGSGKKTVLLFDECDSLLMDRNSIGVILAAEVNTLLSELERYEGVIIFTTNRLGKLDPALERRITAKIEFEFPDKQARLKIWGRMIPKKAPIAKDVDYKHLAEFALVGGNIKNAVLNAARAASYKKLKAIDMNCFLEAIEKEMRGIQSFVAEYEKQDHTSLANNLTRTTTGLSVDREDIKRNIIEGGDTETKKEMVISGKKAKISKLWDDKKGGEK